MKLLSLLLLSLILATGSRAAAGPVEELCAQFAGGAEVRVFRGFPQPAFARDLLERAKKAECLSLLGEVFYPEVKTLNEKDTATWLARATNPDSYYPSDRNATAMDAGFHADIAFWCVTPDHKHQAYCLVSFATSQVQVATTDKGVTVAMTFELEKLSRDFLQQYFEQELKEEKSDSAQKAAR
jgi:hypothetical protein